VNSIEEAVSDPSILEDISSSIPGVIYQFLVGSDGSWAFRYVSKGVEDLFEVSPEDACRDASVMTLCIIEEDRPSHRKSIEYAVKNIAPWHHEHRILTRSGVSKWILATALPVKQEDGSILWNGILTDISEIMAQNTSGQLLPLQENQLQEIARVESKLRKHHKLLSRQISETPLLHNAKLKVLIVEDETALREAMIRILNHFGYDVYGVGSSGELDNALRIFSADILILDINLPGEDGIQIANRIRKKSACGIIMLTGRNQIELRLNSYKSGADMFFAKPIDPEELHAAIESLGRRLSPPSKPGWYFDGNRSLLISPHNVAIPLTSQQAIVLGLLTKHHGDSVPRSDLLAALGHSDDEHGNQRLETMLSRLRAKVRTADPDSEIPLRSRQSSGYAFLDSVI
jgi:DNA-binding response OmpR family regulator